MGSLGEAVLDLAADSTQLDKDVKNAKSRTLNVLGGLADFGKTIFTAGVAVASAGVLALGKGLYDIVQAGAEAEQAQAQLNAVLKSTGGIAGVTADQVNKLADKYSNLTMYDDEAIVSAESLLLTFTNIGKNVFPDATLAVMDLSQSMHQDLQTSAIQLGKALQDPIQGVSALSRVGVNFSEDQKKLIKSLVETGRLEEAQAMILRELQTEFGGSAEAAGKTLPGQLAILQKKLGDIKEVFAGKLNPVLADFLSLINDYISSPQVQNFIEDMAQRLGDFATYIRSNVGNISQTIKNFFTWLQNNKGIIVGILAAISAALAAFAYTTLAPLLPVAAVLAAIGAAAYLVYEAWTNNWGGIRDVLMAAWAQIQPTLDKLKAWFDATMPQVWAVVQPIFKQIGDWLGVAIPIAVKFLVDYFNWAANNFMTVWNFIGGVFKALWDFLSTNVFPILKAIGDVIGAVVGLAFRAWAGIMQNVVIPALQKVWEWIDKNVMPIVRKLAQWLDEHLRPAFEFIGKEIKGVVAWLEVLAYRLSRMKLPGWMTPGSPTPWEIGLRGVHDALRDVGSMSLPALSTTLSAMPAPAIASGGLNFPAAGGPVMVQFSYQPFIGINDEREAENKLFDIITNVNRKVSKK